jgi:hypothetical protein
MKCYRCGMKLRKADRVKIIYRFHGGRYRFVLIHKRGCPKINLVNTREARVFQKLGNGVYLLI